MRVITFVTWRYVALRTFTLHRSPSLSFSWLPRSRKKETSERGRKLRRCSRKVPAKGRNEEQGCYRKGMGENESPRVFCFAAFSRNFYDYRLFGTPALLPSARIEPLIGQRAAVRGARSTLASLLLSRLSGY